MQAPKAAAADFVGSLEPGGYAHDPMDVGDPLGPEEMEPEAIQLEVHEDPMDSLVPASALGPADLPARAMSIIAAVVHASCIAVRTTLFPPGVEKPFLLDLSHESPRP